MTIEEVQEKPLSLSRNLILKHGEEVTFRPLIASDAIPFGKFLDDLSAETRKRFGAHQLDSHEAKNICNNLKYSEMFRLVSVKLNGEIIGYFILSFLFGEEIERYKRYGIEVITEKDVRLAPVVADTYQNKGLGSLMMKESLKVAKELGLRHIILWGGTQATNERAVHFYEKAGFRKVGEFEEQNMNNFDMYLNL